MKPQDDHKGLRILLTVFASLLTACGCVALFATSWAIHTFVPGTSVQALTWLLFAIKALGAVALFLAYLLFVTSRDPIRHVAVIDGFAAFLFLMTVIDVYAVTVLNFGAYFPAWVVWGRIALRIGLGVALIILRPRERQ